MKKCSKCKEMKEFSEFRVNKRAKSGRQSSCKKCANIYYRKNKERLLEKQRKYREKNPEKVKRAVIKCHLENKDKYYEQRKKRYEENEVVRKEAMKRYRKWAKENPEGIKKHLKTYADKNKDKKVLWSAKRRAVKKKSIPVFAENCPLEKTKLKNIYLLSRLLTDATGITHHVDHMWPLADGGPHWSGNLQIIPAEDNFTKHTKVDPAIKATIQEMLAEEERLHAER